MHFLERFNPKLIPITNQPASYRVVKRRDGESIFLFAFRTLGNAFAWQKICELNNIEDPTNPPWEMKIPNG